MFTHHLYNLSFSRVNVFIGKQYILFDCRFIKQRSKEWFAERSSVKVTGSTVHKALGLDTKISQFKHFPTVTVNQQDTQPVVTDAEVDMLEDMNNEENVVTEDYNNDPTDAMLHGSNHEIAAVATLVGKIIPIYYPNLMYVEEGCYSLYNNDGTKFMVISPDDSLRADEASKCKVSLEIKCPFPTTNLVPPVYIDIKQNHALQCLFEKHVMEAD